MGWRLARSLTVLLGEVDAAAPDRSKRMDGTIGDRAHAKRQSDHNPNGAGVVCAVDVTHDPAGGLDCDRLAEHLRDRAARGVEVRVAYLIWNGRICGPQKGWAWRPYRGANPHDKHLHVSVRQDATYYDSPAPWGWDAPAEEDEVTDADLARIQRMINEAMELRDRDHAAKHAEELRLLKQIAEAVKS